MQVLTAGAASTDQLPLVVAIHGLGDRPEQFAWLLRDLPTKARIIVPRGLDRWHGGYSWFPIRVWDPDPQRTAQGIQRAVDALVPAIEELRKRHEVAGRVVVTGFSQGGMIAFALAVQQPELVHAAYPIAGWLPKTLWPTAAPPARAPPIIAFHGVDDDLLPIGPTQQLVGALDELGFDVELREQPRTGHTISPQVRDALNRLVADATQQLQASSSQSASASAPAPP